MGCHRGLVGVRVEASIRVTPVDELELEKSAFGARRSGLSVFPPGRFAAWAWPGSEPKSTPPDFPGPTEQEKSFVGQRAVSHDPPGFWSVLTFNSFNHSHTDTGSTSDHHLVKFLGTEPHHALTILVYDRLFLCFTCYYKRARDCPPIMTFSSSPTSSSTIIKLKPIDLMVC